MAEQIKSVVVEIETKLQGGGLDQLNRSLDQTENLTDQLQRSIKAVDETLRRNKSQREFKIAGAATTRKELQELSNALKLTEREFSTLSKEQKAVTAQLLNDISKTVDAMEKQNAAQSSVIDSNENLIRGLNVLTPLMGQHGVAISLAVSNLLEYNQAARQGDAASSSLGSVISLLKNKYVALAAAVTAVVGVGLNEYFGKTDEGADKLDQTLTALKETGRSLTGSLANLAGAGFNALTGNFTKAGEDLSQAGRLFKDAFSGEAIQRGVEFSKLVDEIEDRAASLRITTANLSLEFASLREALTDQIITVDDASQALTNLEKLNAVSAELAKSQLAVKQAELDVAIQRAANFSQFDNLTVQTIRNAIATGDLSQITEQYRDAILSAYEALKLVEEQEAQRGRTIGRQEKAIRRQADDIGGIFVESVAQLDQAFADAERSIGSFLRNGVKPEDANKIKAEVAKIVTDVTNQFDQLIKQGERVAPGLFTGDAAQQAFRANQLNIPPEFIEALKDRFEFVGEQAAAVFAVSFKDGLLPAFGQKEIQLDLPPVKPVNKRGEGFFDQLFSQDALKGVQDDIINAFNTFIDTEIAKTDFLIQEQQRRIDEVNNRAALGNAEQLQLEQERLNELINQRQEFEKRQQAINAAAAVSATAVTAANFAAALTKDAATLTPVVAIANSVALLATIAAGIAQISQLTQGFEQGTDYLQPNQKSKRGKTDTIPAWLAPGERVVPASVNSALKGIRNEDLPKLVAAGKIALEGYGQLNTNITATSYGFTSEAVGILKRVEAGISEIPRALQDQIVDIQFDHYGYVIQQKKIARHSEKVKALTR